MNWYQITGYWINSTGNRVLDCGQGSSGVYKYNNDLYGLNNLDFPQLNLYLVQPTGDDMLTRINATGIGDIVDFNSTTPYRYGYPFLIKSEKTLDISGAEILKLSNSTIVGKRKFKSVITDYPYLSYCFIPVTFQIDSTVYDGFTFSYAKKPWYVKAQGSSYNERHQALFGWNGYSSSSYRNNIDTFKSTYVALFSKDNFSNTNEYENLTFITDNYNEWAGKIIDFGDIPQDVPSTFKTWLESVTEEYYPYSYAVYSFDGNEKLAEITEAPPMKNALLTTIADRKTLTLTGINDIVYTLEWSSPTPIGYQFIGISNNPKSNRPTITVNIDTGVSWIGNLTFYESYGTYRPPATTFDINLYQNSAEVNRVDKGQFLVGVGTLSGALREECSMLTPSIVYQSSDVPTFNYVYIPIFNRYYYVTSLSSVSKNVWRMELNCDVLMTYKEQIFLLQGVIGRQEIDFNPLLVDNELPTQNNPIVEVIDIPSDAFNTQTSDAGHNYVITVIGA